MSLQPSDDRAPAGTPLLCTAVLLGRWVPAPLRRCVVPHPKREEPGTTLAFCLRAYLKEELASCIDRISAWHTWTRTASCHGPPEAFGRTELFYWRTGGWQPGCASDWSVGEKVTDERLLRGDAVLAQQV